MKTLKIMSIEEILKLAEYKFTHIPENLECAFDLEEKRCSIFITLKNGTYTTICYVDWDKVKEKRKKYILDNEIEYIVFVYDEEVYSNININITEGTTYECLEGILDSIHFNVYKEHYKKRYF